MKVRVEVDLSPNLSRKYEERLGAFVESVMAETLQAASKFTPKRSGSAARAWETRGQGKNTTVENHKPYIERLEAGSSGQAPRGILSPTLQEIRRRRIVK